MTDKALLLCAASMLGLGVWRYWLAGQGGIRLRGSVAVWLLIAAAGACAAASRYLATAAYAATTDADPAAKAQVLADGLAQAINASAAAMACLAAGALLLGALTFAHRRREARG